MRNKRITGVICLAILTLGAGLIIWIHKDSFGQGVPIEEARARCGNTAWIIRRDSPFHDIIQIDLTDESSYKYDQSPQAAQDGPISFTCTQQQANRVVWFENTFMFALYLFVLPFWLVLLLVIGVVGWLWEELKHRRQKPKTDNKQS